MFDLNNSSLKSFPTVRKAGCEFFKPCLEFIKKILCYVILGLSTISKYISSLRM